MSSSKAEPFTLISTQSSNALTPDYTDFKSARVADVDVQLTKALREHYPELCVTIVPASNAPLIEFAAAGFATAELDTESESIFRWRGYVPAAHRGGSGGVGDAIFFAKYHYKWSDMDFIVYTIENGLQVNQYILKEPDVKNGEDTLSNCAATDALIKTCAEALLGDETDFVYVYDDYWTRSRSLWKEVQKASWDDVILDAKMKKALTDVTKNFFDSKDVYDRFSVPWKRGLIFYGPPGNGKTISIKALMKELSRREKQPIPTLYVKNAPDTYDIGSVFSFARQMSPCMLVLEDIETIVTQRTRSYFFNEVDGLGNNNGILMVASTNYLDRLDSGLSKRPSRFDRKYEFPLPSESEREEYAEYWRQKLARTSSSIEFPKKLCPAIAGITQKFSFAYMQEAFIASLLMLARDEEDSEAGEQILAEDDTNDPYFKGFEKHHHSDPLDKYKLWRAMKFNVKLLRQDMEDDDDDGGDDDADEGDVIIRGRHVGKSTGKAALGATRALPYRDEISRLERFSSSQVPKAVPKEPVGPNAIPHAPRGEGSIGGTPRSFWQNLRLTEDNIGGRHYVDQFEYMREQRSPVSNNPFTRRSRRGGGVADSPMMEKRGKAEPSQSEVEDAGVLKAKRLTETAFEAY